MAQGRSTGSHACICIVERHRVFKLILTLLFQFALFNSLLIHDGNYPSLDIGDTSLLRSLYLLAHFVSLYLNNDLLTSFFPNFACSQFLIFTRSENLFTSLDTIIHLHFLLDMVCISEDDVIVLQLEGNFVKHLYGKSLIAYAHMKLINVRLGNLRQFFPLHPVG